MTLPSRAQRALQVAGGGCPPPRAGGGALLQETLQDPLFQAFCELVLPGVADVYVVPHRLPLRGGSQPWRKPEGQGRIDHRSALAAQLLASDGDEGFHLPGYSQPVRAVGFSYRPDAQIRRVSFDLDGTAAGYSPPEIVKQLQQYFGERQLLVHSGSGREGRYRCEALVHQGPIGDVTARLRAAFEALDFPAVKGGVEIYPATSNGRLPFGPGGRRVFLGSGPWSSPARLVPHERQFLWRELVEWLLELTPLDLRARPVEAVPPLQGPSRVATSPRPAPVGGPPPRREPARPRGVARALADAWSKVERWWGAGVERGERDEALFMLLRDCRRRGLREGQAVGDLQAWIDHGGLTRSSVGADRVALAQERDVHVPEIARRVYAHLRPRLDPTHLTRREVAAAYALAEQRCPGRVGQAVVLLLSALPWFKSAALAGLDGILLHRQRWAGLLGRRRGYPEIRKALGLFVRGRGPWTGERSTTWHLFSPSAFPFDSEAPARALVATRGRPIAHQVATRGRPIAHQVATRGRRIAKIVAKAREVALAWREAARRREQGR